MAPLSHDRVGSTRQTVSLGWPFHEPRDLPQHLLLCPEVENRGCLLSEQCSMLRGIFHEHAPPHGWNLVGTHDLAVAVDAAHQTDTYLRRADSLSDNVRRCEASVCRAGYVQIRVGLNSGEVVVRAVGSDLRMDYTAVGQTTHLAARMEQFASPGSVLLTPSTLELVEGFVAVKPLGPVPVKGLADAVEVYEVTGAGAARTRLEAAARRGLTRFVGRGAELEQLRGALDRASRGHGQVVAVVGEPGVGKSRLFWELLHSHRVHGWLIVQSASVSYGKATAYLPVIELLRGYFEID